MRKIAVDVRMLESSGIGRYLSELIPRLISEGAAKFALLGDLQAMERQGLTQRANVERIPVRSAIYTVREQLEIAAKRPRDADLFWSPHYNIPLSGGAPMLITIHDVLHLARPEYVGGFHRRLYARGMFAAIRRKAAHIICDSQFTADELMRVARIPHDRITVIHLGVSEAWFEPAVATAPDPRPYLLCIGNVKPHKNLGLLLEAYSEIQARIPHDLVVVGRKEGFRTADEAVLRNAEDLRGRVHFTGLISDSKLREYLSNASCLVFPSLYEGFGLPALEAMAAGCPVLSSTAASLPEICGDAAMYFDPRKSTALATKILSFLNAPARADDLREKGRARARQFTWEKCASQTQEVITSVLT